MTRLVNRSAIKLKALRSATARAVASAIPAQLKIPAVRFRCDARFISPPCRETVFYLVQARLPPRTALGYYNRGTSGIALMGYSRLRSQLRSSMLRVGRSIAGTPAPRNRERSEQPSPLSSFSSCACYRAPPAHSVHNRGDGETPSVHTRQIRSTIHFRISLRRNL